MGLLMVNMLAAQNNNRTKQENKLHGMPDSVQQQKELDAWVAPIVHQLDSLRNGWIAWEQQHFDSVSKKFDTSGLADVQAKNTNLSKQKRQLFNQFAGLHPHYKISLVALQQGLVPVPDDIQVTKRLFNALDKNIRQTTSGIQLERVINGFMKVAIGNLAPLFSAPDTLGRLINLASFRGKYVLLDFWASWCGPCRQENPNVAKAYMEFHAKNFEVLSVSLDQPGKKSAWLNAIHQDNMNWQHVSDLNYWDSKVAKLYSIKSIPQNFLINPKGVIIATNLRGEKLFNTLQKLL